MANHEGTPLHGDRGAYDVISFPTEHARDISDDTLTRHLPAPGAEGSYARDDGSHWTRTLGLALADLTSYARGAIIRGGAAVWEALAIGVTGTVLKSDGTDVVWGNVDHSELTGVGADDHHIAFVPADINTLAKLNAIVTDATLDDAGDPRTDDDAIHDNVAGEIHAITAKATPVGADEIVIEDSEDLWSKKRVALDDLPGGGGGGHEIQDDGTPMAQRSALNFVGFTVTDDALNNATEICGDGDMTKSVYDTNSSNVVDSAEAVEGVNAAGNNRYYGTNSAGTPGFHALPEIPDTAYSETVGDGVDTSFDINHQLGTLDLVVQVWDEDANPVALTSPSGIYAVDADTVRITFSSAPGVDQMRVVVLAGGGGGSAGGAATRQLYFTNISMSGSNLFPRASITATASHGAGTLINALDGTVDALQYTTGANQAIGMYVQFDLGAPFGLFKIRQHCVAGSYYASDYPRAWEILGSNTGAFGGEEVQVATGTASAAGVIDSDFAATAYRYWRIRLTANQANYWKVNEFELHVYTELTVCGLVVGQRGISYDAADAQLESLQSTVSMPNLLFSGGPISRIEITDPGGSAVVLNEALTYTAGDVYSFY